jgi:hypothetical protein
VKPIRFTRGSRRHRIGKAAAYQVITTAPVDVGDDPGTGDTTLVWVGEDQRGRELEIVAIEKPDCFLVIHVMPTHYRKGTS